MVNNSNGQSLITVPKLWLWVSGLVAGLATITSLFGILSKETYSREVEAWAVQAVGQDYANLISVLLLAISTYYLSKHSLRAYLVWLGIYMYLIYSFAIYAFSVHFNFLFLAYVAIFGLSIYALIGGLAAADIEKFSKVLLPNKKAKMAGILLLTIGVLFYLLWLSEIIPNLVTNTVPKTLVDTQLWTNPVYVLDLGLLLPAMILAAIWIRQKKVWGYLLAVPLLVFAVTMGLGIVILFAISAAKGLPYSLPGGVIVGAIIVLSTYFATLFLKDVPDR